MASALSGVVGCSFSGYTDVSKSTGLMSTCIGVVRCHFSHYWLPMKSPAIWAERGLALISLLPLVKWITPCTWVRVVGTLRPRRTAVPAKERDLSVSRIVSDRGVAWWNVAVGVTTRNPFFRKNPPVLT